MALLTTQNIATTGLAATYQAATASDTMVPGYSDFLHVKNGGGGALTVTVVTPGLVDGTLTVQDRVITVTAGTDQMVKVTPELYRDPTTGVATITFSPITSVTIAALRV